MGLEQLLVRQHSPIPTSLSTAGSGTHSAEFHDKFSHPEDFCQAEIIKQDVQRPEESGAD